MPTLALAVSLLLAVPQSGDREPQPNLGNDPTRAVVRRQERVDVLDPNAELPDLASYVSSGWNTEVHGYLRSSYMWSDDVQLYSPDDLGGFSVDGLRLFLRSEVEDWRFHVALRGEEGPDLGFFGVPNSVGEVRMPEAWAMYEVYDDIFVRVGKFRTPFVATAMQEENGMLFYNRSFVGTDWERYRTGVQIDGHKGPLRGWFAVQNGADGAGEDVSLTMRGMWDVFGGGTNQEYEGARDAPEGLAMSIAGSLYYDTANDNFSSQAIEARMTFLGFYLAGELVDKGNGLGDLYSWAGTASYMLLDDLELAVGFEDFDRDDETDLWRSSISYYLDGNNAKVQLVNAYAKSNAPLAEGNVLILGLTVAF